MINYNEEILYHYGIKRRSGRYPYGSGERPYQRTTIDQKRQESIRNITQNKKPVKFRRLSVTNKPKQVAEIYVDRTIKKGSKVYRISSNKQEDYKNRPTFVTADPVDASLYLNVMPGNYQKIYNLKQDIKVPGITNIAYNLIPIVLENDDSFNISIDEAIPRLKQASESTYGNIDNLPQYLRNQTINEPNQAAITFVQSILKSSSGDLGEVGNKLVEKLKQQGYDAMPDLLDIAGSYRAPMLIFEPDKVFETNHKTIDVSDPDKRFDLSQIFRNAEFDDSQRVSYTMDPSDQKRYNEILTEFQKIYEEYWDDIKK